MKRIVFVFTTFLMLGVNLDAEVQITNKLPIKEKINKKINIDKEIQEANAMEEKSELVKLAKKHFDDLSEAEIKFLTAVEKEEIADYTSSNEEENNPENADRWGNDRILHAKKIQWLCTNPEPAKLVTRKGIQIIGARIEGELDLQFEEMGFPLAFFKCIFDDTIYLQYAQIRVLHFGGTHTERIEADCLDIKGSVFLNDGFKAKGGVRLGFATIGGNLKCDNGEFIKPSESVDHEGRALFADGINVKGNVFLRNGFKAEGEVRFPSANIGGDLDCIKGKFVNPNKIAFGADGINVKGAVFLRDSFKAKGEVRFIGATIGGDFDCSRNPKIKTKAGEFINPTGRAINADRINVKGSVFLKYGFMAEGKISLDNAIINRRFVYTDVESPEKVILDLRSAKIGTLWDQKESWPKEGNLFLNGLVYDDLDDEAPKDAKSRIEWLRLNGGKEFNPQPYEQLAEVLKRNGHEKDAKEVLIAKNKDLVELGAELSITQKVWYKFIGPMIGYGYKPLDVFWKGPMGIKFWGSILFWMMLGSVVFWFGYYGKSKLMSPSKTGVYAEDAGKTNTKIHNEYPTFQFITYSIDAFLPVVDLHQSKYWLPNANKGNVLLETRWFTIRWGGVLLFYLWGHIVIGWVLSTLFVVGLTGLIRT